MSTETKRPASAGSGEHPIVVEFRRKLDSIAEHEVPAAAELRERIEELRAKSDRPPKDPRRDGDDEIPVDEVRPSTLPTPPTARPTTENK